MKKTGQLIFNIFWVLLVGLASAISSGITGIALCLTIIGIPLGLQYFKYIKLVFAPAGKVVARKFSAHPVLNTLWLIFGGLEWYIIYNLLALVFYITIIGIPIGRQLTKIADFHLAPFGCEVVAEDEYTERKDTSHNKYLLLRRIGADENAYEKLKHTKEDARKCYDKCKKKNALLGDKKSELITVLFGAIKEDKTFAISAVITTVVIFVPFIILAILNIFKYYEAIFAGIMVSIFAIFFVFIALVAIAEVKEWNRFYKKHIFPLMDQYPNGSLMLEKDISIESLATMLGLLDTDEENLSAEFLKNRQNKK